MLIIYEVPLHDCSGIFMRIKLVNSLETNSGKYGIRRIISCMKTNVKGAVLATVGGILWGLSGSVGQYLFMYENMDSRWLVPVRMGASALILFIFCFFRYGRRTFEPWKTKQNVKDLLFYGIFGISCCQLLYYITIQLSNAGAATILQDLAPIFILIFTCIIEKRGPRFLEVGAISLAMIGVFLITTHGSGMSASIPLLALLAGIGCSISVMIYNVAPRRLLKQYPSPILQSWAFLMGCVLFGCSFQIWKMTYVPSLRAVLGIAFIVVVDNILAFSFYMEGVKLIGASKAVLYGFTEPTTAALVTFLFMNSPFTFWDGVGFACIFAMLVLISINENRSSKKD